MVEGFVIKDIIIFDFDGVILDSNEVKLFGFKKIFENFSSEQVDKLLIYHEKNGGLSRFHKIKYFYNEILEKEISSERVIEYANKFGDIMKNELIKNKYLIHQTLNFIVTNKSRYRMHIASGSEHLELNYLCSKLKIKEYFLSIDGSPTIKSQIVKNIITNYNYNVNKCCLIGDSINDFEASQVNSVDFIGFNNLDLINRGRHYIHDFSRFKLSNLN